MFEFRNESTELVFDARDVEGPKRGIEKFPAADCSRHIDQFLRNLASQGREAVELTLEYKEGLSQDILHWIVEYEICGSELANFWDAYSSLEANTICAVVANSVYPMTTDEILVYAET
jgi:hypothetical protein